MSPSIGGPSGGPGEAPIEPSNDEDEPLPEHVPKDMDVSAYAVASDEFGNLTGLVNPNASEMRVLLEQLEESPQGSPRHKTLQRDLADLQSQVIEVRKGDMVEVTDDETVETRVAKVVQVGPSFNFLSVQWYMKRTEVQLQPGFQLLEKELLKSSDSQGYLRVDRVTRKVRIIAERPSSGHLRDGEYLVNPQYGYDVKKKCTIEGLPDDLTENQVVRSARVSDDFQAELPACRNVEKVEEKKLPADQVKEKNVELRSVSDSVEEYDQAKKAGKSLFAKMAPGEGLQGFDLMKHYTNEAVRALPPAAGTLTYVKPRECSKYDDWRWASVGFSHDGRVSIELPINKTMNETVTFERELVVEQSSAANDFAMDVLSDNEGNAATALEFIYSQGGKAAYVAHLEAKGLIWTPQQIQTAITIQNNVGREEMVTKEGHEPGGVSLLGEEYDHDKYSKAVPGKTVHELIDFLNRYRPDKRSRAWRDAEAANEMGPTQGSLGSLDNEEEDPFEGTGKGKAKAKPKQNAGTSSGGSAAPASPADHSAGVTPPPPQMTSLGHCMSPESKNGEKPPANKKQKVSPGLNLAGMAMENFQKCLDLLDFNSPPVPRTGGVDNQQADLVDFLQKATESSSSNNDRAMILAGPRGVGKTTAFRAALEVFEAATHISLEVKSDRLDGQSDTHAKVLKTLQALEVSEASQPGGCALKATRQTLTVLHIDGVEFPLEPVALASLAGLTREHNGCFALVYEVISVDPYFEYVNRKMEERDPQALLHTVYMRPCGAAQLHYILMQTVDDPEMGDKSKAALRSIAEAAAFRCGNIRVALTIAAAAFKSRWKELRDLEAAAWDRHFGARIAAAASEVSSFGAALASTGGGSSSHGRGGDGQGSGSSPSLSSSSTGSGSATTASVLLTAANAQAAINMVLPQKEEQANGSGAGGQGSGSFSSLLPSPVSSGSATTASVFHTDINTEAPQ